MVADVLLGDVPETAVIDGSSRCLVARHPRSTRRGLPFALGKGRRIFPRCSANVDGVLVLLGKGRRSTPCCLGKGRRSARAARHGSTGFPVLLGEGRRVFPCFSAKVGGVPMLLGQRSAKYPCCSARVDGVSRAARQGWAGFFRAAWPMMHPAPPQATQAKVGGFSHTAWPMMHPAPPQATQAKVGSSASAETAPPLHGGRLTKRSGPAQPTPQKSQGGRATCSAH